MLLINLKINNMGERDNFKAISYEYASLYPNTMKKFDIKPEKLASVKRHIRKMKYKKLFEND
jgi:hypothetical protein